MRSIRTTTASREEFAQGLAARVLRDPKADDAGRLRQAFRLCLARPPRDFELKRLGELLAEQYAGYAAGPQDVKGLAPAKVADPKEAGRLAAWATVGRVLINLDEFITRE